MGHAGLSATGLTGGVRAGLANVARSPRSTVVGLCVLALAAARGVHFDAAGRLAMTSKDWFEVLCGLLTAAVSAVSVDARAPLNDQTAKRSADAQ